MKNSAKYLLGALCLLGVSGSAFTAVKPGHFYNASAHVIEITYQICSLPLDCGSEKTIAIDSEVTTVPDLIPDKHFLVVKKAETTVAGVNYNSTYQAGSVCNITNPHIHNALYFTVEATTGPEGAIGCSQQLVIP